MIGIICAIPDEIAYFKDLHIQKQSQIAKFTFFEGEIANKKVIIVESGMGKVNATIITTLLIQKFNCNFIIFSGVAGGLDPSLKVKDIVIAQNIIQYDYGLIRNKEFETYQAGYLPFYMPTDEIGYKLKDSLLNKIKICLNNIEINYGTILTGDQFIHCPEKRKELFEKYKAQAVEMEGAAVAQVAESFNVDWLIIRALSDLAGEDSSFDFINFLKETASLAAKIVCKIIEK